MLNPHPALDPGLPAEEQHVLQRNHRQLLVQGVLASLLPTEDLQNSPLRILVTDIIADLILGRVTDDRLCKGWFLHETVSKVVAVITARTQPKITHAEMQADARSRLEKFGLLSANTGDLHDNSPEIRQSTVSAWFWMVLQWIYLAFVSIRLIILASCTLGVCLLDDSTRPCHHPRLPTQRLQLLKWKRSVVSSRSKLQDL